MSLPVQHFLCMTNGQLGTGGPVFSGITSEGVDSYIFYPMYINPIGIGKHLVKGKYLLIKMNFTYKNLF